MIFPGSILEKLGEYTAARNDPTILAKCSLLHLAFNRSRWNIVYSSHIKLQCFEANVIGRQIKPQLSNLKHVTIYQEALPQSQIAQENDHVAE
jgi:hypothetical protein